MAIVFWLIFCILVGMIGDKRNIGFGWAFIASVVLSPLIGLIIALLSSKKVELNSNN